jgi:hypothetical protein
MDKSRAIQVGSEAHNRLLRRQTIIHNSDRINIPRIRKNGYADNQIRVMELRQLLAMLRRVELSIQQELFIRGSINAIKRKSNKTKKRKV